MLLLALLIGCPQTPPVDVDDSAVVDDTAPDAGGDSGGETDSGDGADSGAVSDSGAGDTANEVVPQAVVDLAVAATGSSSLQATWTEADDGLGGPSNYLVQWAPTPLSWGSAGASTRLVSGGSVGSVASIVLTGLDPATSYDVALAPYRGTPGIDAVFGAVSPIVTATTDDPPPNVAQVVVAPASVTVDVGSTVALSAEPRDGSGTAVSTPVGWTSDDDTIASVDASGVVTAVGAGVTTVRATASCCGVEGSATVTVPDPNGPPVWYEQDFTSFSSLADLLASPEVEDATYPGPGYLQFLTGQTTPWGGDRVVETHYDGHAQIGINLYPPLSDTDRPREVWFEVYMKADPAWQPASDHKTLFYLESGQVNRWEIKAGSFGSQLLGNIENGAVHWEVACLPPVGSLQNNGGSHPNCNNRPDLPTMLWDGSWHVIRWHLRMATDENATDGLHEVWIDGTPVLHTDNIHTASPASRYFQVIALSRNGDPHASASLYWGRVRVWTTDPSW